MQRKLTQAQVLAIPQLKKSMTWKQVAEYFKVSVPLVKYYGTKLKKEGHEIYKQPAMPPLDLSGNNF